MASILCRLNGLTHESQLHSTVCNRPTQNRTTSRKIKREKNKRVNKASVLREAVLVVLTPLNGISFGLKQFHEIAVIAMQLLCFFSRSADQAKVNLLSFFGTISPLISSYLLVFFRELLCYLRRPWYILQQHNSNFFNKDSTKIQRIEVQPTNLKRSSKDRHKRDA